QGTVNYTRIISPHLVNEFMIGIFYSTEVGPPVDDDALHSMQRQYRGLSGLGQFAPRNNPLNIIPKATFGGVPTSYVAASIYYDNRWPLTGADTALTSSNNLTYTRGPHTFKAGVWWELARFGQARASLFGGTFDFANDPNDPLNLGYAFANAYTGHFRQYTE